MVKNIILSNPKEQRTPRQDGSSIINISELLSRTVQGENFSGYPSVILRMQGCTQKCSYCDSKETWNKGNPYSVWELAELFDTSGIKDDLDKGHHLILTGGSPLMQQEQIIEFLDIFFELYKFRPFIEIENECVIMPSLDMLESVNLWNNSPKLASSGNDMNNRYKPEVLKTLAELENSFFKFVVSKDEDWDEIKALYLDTEILSRDKIVLMPEGASRKELQARYEWLVELCCRESVKMSDRLHVTIWDSKKGV